MILSYLEKLRRKYLHNLIMSSQELFFYAMPYKPKVSCKYPLCSAVINPSERYCSKHKQPICEIDSKRNSINSKVYNTTWRKLRRVKLSSNLLCELCLAKGKVAQAEEVDHVRPVSQYPELRLVYDNLQSLCVTCHSKKTREENKIIKF